MKKKALHSYKKEQNFQIYFQYLKCLFLESLKRFKSNGSEID